MAWVDTSVDIIVHIGSIGGRTVVAVRSEVLRSNFRRGYILGPLVVRYLQWSPSEIGSRPRRTLMMSDIRIPRERRGRVVKDQTALTTVVYIIGRILQSSVDRV